jgi:hypothetical protein
MEIKFISEKFKAPTSYNITSVIIQLKLFSLQKFTAISLNCLFPHQAFFQEKFFELHRK